ncbi:MAG: gluconate 2-dehydrogenase subunit 3 family protein [Bryobacteraceae bacterium]
MGDFLDGGPVEGGQCRARIAGVAARIVRMTGNHSERQFLSGIRRDCDNVSETMKPTRRVFLGASASTPILITAIQPAASALAEEVQNELKTVMDLIIPASDGMPSASEAGGLSYLENLKQRNKDVASDVARALDVARAFSERSFKIPFRQLEKNDQIAVLKEMENTAVGVFDALRAYIYESYYTQPTIWKLIGYELYPTDHMGPHLKPFDDSLLADVRKMPKLYRDV